jgi:hypothetical protein
MVDAEVKGHHTVWVRKRDWSRAAPVRYAVSGDALVAFGDGPLRTLAAGDRATLAIHEIAGGPVIASFGASVVEVRPTEVDREAVLELLAHVPLGANLAEVDAKVAEVCRTRRILALVP